MPNGAFGWYMKMKISQRTPFLELIVARDCPRSPLTAQTPFYLRPYEP